MSMKYSDRQIEDLLDGLFKGEITEYDLPEDLYLATAEYLKAGLYEGFGSKLSQLEAGTPDFEILESLRTNVFIFSGAKTYQQMRDMTALLTDPEGEIRPWKDFRVDALAIYDEYNVNWLETERSTAIGQAANAELWTSIEKDKELLPFLRYSAVEDANTSEICAPLDGIVLPVDDPFWDEFMPLNHFNCRCLVEQLGEEDAKVTDPEMLKDMAAGPREKITDFFNTNVGKTGRAFDKEHPYFDVPKEDREYAKNNFNLEIPEEDE